MRYSYFVLYQIEMTHVTRVPVLNGTVDRKVPIIDHDEIRAIETELSHRHSGAAVTLLSWRRYESPE